MFWREELKIHLHSSSTHINRRVIASLSTLDMDDGQSFDMHAISRYHMSDDSSSFDSQSILVQSLDMQQAAS